jgi:hypothetical protein
LIPGLYNQVSYLSYLEQLLSKVFKADSENPEHPQKFSRTKFEFCARLLGKEKNAKGISIRHFYSINSDSFRGKQGSVIKCIGLSQKQI